MKSRSVWQTPLESAKIKFSLDLQCQRTSRDISGDTALYIYWDQAMSNYSELKFTEDNNSETFIPLKSKTFYKGLLTYPSDGQDYLIMKKLTSVNNSGTAILQYVV